MENQPQSLNKQLKWLENFIVNEDLPESFMTTACDCYLPLVEQLTKICTKDKHKGKPLVIGINGAQGTGKSTLAAIIAGLLAIEGYSSQVISIDDLYLTLAERKQLAEDIHPLLQTRGVPGTHDVSLGIQLIRYLCGETTIKVPEHEIPRFDKSIDDRAPKGTPLPESPPDFILLEGWCVGAIAFNDADLTTGANELEKLEDSDGKWRTFINDNLCGDYQSLFELIDFLVMLKAPDFECVHEWRGEQESKLRARIIAQEGMTAVGTHKGLMNEAQLHRFIMHYERLTRWILSEMPQRADCVMHLTREHQISRVHYSATMTNQPKLLIFTDLDATLLDESYSWEAARESLKKLNELNCPVILNSSKTHSEMATIARDLATSLNMPYYPLIAENGGVVAIPEVSDKLEQDQSEVSYQLEYPGLSRKEILAIVHQLREREGYRFRGFADMTVSDVCELTGLKPADAALSLQRHATEPIVWEDTDERWQAFESAIANHSIRALRGGRFIHLMGEVDKADGLWHVHEIFKSQSEWILIALGDSPNDLAMLNSADIAIAITNPMRHVQLDISAPHVIRPLQYGPAGWHEGMQQVIEQIFDF